MTETARRVPQIADHYVLSLKPVRDHVSNVLTKLGVATRAEAIVAAREAGLVPCVVWSRQVLPGRMTPFS